MENLTLAKKEFFAFMRVFNPTVEELATLREWLVEFTAYKTDQLPCPVEIYKGWDRDEEQNGMETILTTFYSKLIDAGGQPLFAYLGAKVLFNPVNGSSNLKTVSDLKNAAKKVWKKARPMLQSDWVNFSTHQKTYMDLNKILKGLPNPVDLPDIRDHIFYLHDNSDDCQVVSRIDIKTGEVKIVKVSEIDYILCVAE